VPEPRDGFPDRPQPQPAGTAIRPVSYRDTHNHVATCANPAGLFRGCPLLRFPPSVIRGFARTSRGCGQNETLAAARERVFLMGESIHPNQSNPESDVTRLMCDLGATRWDPTPVDQLDFFLDEIPGESARQRMLAWLRAHTIRRGRWKSYAVDENRNEVPAGQATPLAIVPLWQSEAQNKYPRVKMDANIQAVVHRILLLCSRSPWSARWPTGIPRGGPRLWRAWSGSTSGSNW
jgi:hypothetical protein